MSTLETKMAIIGAVLCLLGLMLFAYGMSNMNHMNAVSGSFTIIVGIFIGMAGMFMLMIDLFPWRRTF